MAETLDSPFGIKLNRKERRDLQRMRKKLTEQEIPVTPFIQLQSADTLLGLETEGIAFYQQELSNFTQAIDLARTGFNYFTILMNTGVSDGTVRTHLLNCDREDYNPYEYHVAIRHEADNSKFMRSFSILAQLERKIQRSKRFLLEGDSELYTRMLQDKTVRAVDIYGEITRSLEETAGLLQLEIDWLVDCERKRFTSHSQEDVIEDKPDKVLVESDEDPFLLSNWDLYWTNRHWSMEDSQLVKIPTGSRKEAVEYTRTITLGEVMIKPGSIVRALEFYLQKDIIQRALSSRLRHVPDYIKEWIKIKRGRDRILLAVPEEGRAIFFAGNRDVIYRNI